MLILEQASAPGIAELAQPELAGLRMNPANNGPSRMRYITGYEGTAIVGLPAQLLISYVQRSYGYLPDPVRAV